MKLTPFDPDLRTIFDRINNGDFDLQPEFQRQEVWSTAKKRRLIDTVLRGWSVPPIYLVEVDDARMEVLDGQQRLAAIRDFFNNKISIDPTIMPIDEKIQSLGGKFYKGLPVPQKRIFDQYSLRCFRITDYEPDEPNELFYRLNQPSMLTAGEQRNAFYGPARNQLKEAVTEFELHINGKEGIGFSNGRLAYDDIIARLLVFIEAGTFGIKGTEIFVSQRFKERRPFSARVSEQAGKAISLFAESLKAAGSVKLNKASCLSWLLFFARMPEKNKFDNGFMSYFVASNIEFHGNILEFDAALTFRDRSSLRVTDVSSVIFRDFVLWLIYSIKNPSLVPENINIKTINYVKECWKRRTENISLEDVLDAVLDQQAWGAF